MVETLVKNLTSERLSQGGFGQERVVQMGQLAIKSEQLRINDPLTHLYQYLERGDESLVGIREDIETDIAERLPRTPFVNQVGFEFTGDDFVSVKDKVSMKSMTENNLQILVAEQVANPDLSAELARAEIEAKEADKLSTWFADASFGAFLVFESLPIGKQKVAVSRIYQKTGEQSLDSGFVSLYGPSVEIFNDFRKKVGVGKSDCNTELDVLENNYEFCDDSGLISMDQFVENYVGAYDHLQEEKFGKKHRFGLQQDEETAINNGLEKVRSQSKLTSIYVDAVKSLAVGQGKVSHELIHINEKLGLGFRLSQGDLVSAQTARTVLSEVIRGITSAIDRADVDLLFNIEQPNYDMELGYDAVSHYGGEARSEGASYASEACPESSSSSQPGAANSSSISETNILLGAFNPSNYPPNFGDRKIGICKTRNCPSRKESSITIGGCGFCLKCHLLYEKKGNSPEKIYDDKWKKEVEQEIKRKKDDEEKMLRKQIETEKIKKQKAIKEKQKFMQKMNQRKKAKQKTFFQKIEEIGKKAA